MIPVANARDYLQALPDAHLVTFPGLGHVPQEEAPVKSVEAVRAFLSPDGPSNRRRPLAGSRAQSP